MNRKGVSLVALLITVVVMLILVVSVVLLAAGQDGIINKAQQAKLNSELNTAKEKVNLEMSAINIDASIRRQKASDFMTDNAKLLRELSQRDITYMISGENIIFTVDQKYSVVTDLDGNITGATLTDAINGYRYGDIIYYAVSLDPLGENSQVEGHIDGWKIFYEDVDYIYIIAADYIDNSLLPNGTGMLNMSKADNYPYSAFWTNTSAFTNASSASIDATKAKKFGLTWLDNVSSTTSPNSRATADLFDSSWSTAFGSGITDVPCEVIGGPTIEMFVKSWNSQGHTELATNYSERGYDIGIDGEALTSGINLNNASYEGYNDTLYYPHLATFGECNGYWIASPAATSINNVMRLLCDGRIGSYLHTTNGLGVRPVVLIQKSLVEITETSLGSGRWNVTKR